MKKYTKPIAIAMTAMSLALALGGCAPEAQRVSHNVSQEADNFNVIRRLVVINLRTDTPLFEVVGAFSLQESGDRLVIVVETGHGEYKKHFVGLTNEVFWNIEDISGASVSKYHYEVNFLPEMIIPIEFQSHS